MRTDTSGQPTWKSVLVALGLAAGLALSVAACGSDGDTQTAGTTTSSPPTSTSNPVRCDDLAALRDSLRALTTITVQRGMAEELKADLADVQAKLAALASSIRAEFREATGELESALGTLGTAVEALAANPSSETTSAVTSALSEVNTAWADLVTALATRCPELSASPTT